MFFKRASALLRWIVLAAIGFTTAGNLASAKEKEYRPLFRGGRAMALGGAYVALADDEQAVFLNPAGMAGVESPELRYVTLDTVLGSSLVNSVKAARESITSLPTDLTAIGSLLMAKDVYAQLQFAPTLIAPNIGFGYLADWQTGLVLKNKALPQLSFGYQITHGLQVATGISLMGRRAKKKWDVRIGVAGKWMYRRGGYNDLAIADIMRMRRDFVTVQAPGFGSAYGGDLGVQLIRKVGRSWRLMAGAAYTDVGNTVFTGSTKTDPQLGNVSVGVATKLQVFSWLSTQLSYEANQLNYTNIDWRKKNHAGLEIAMPFVTLRGGINQVFFTYGASADLWLLSFTFYSYKEELDTLVNQYPQRRFGLTSVLKFAI